MREFSNNYHNTSGQIIDLRQKPKKASVAWSELTAFRIILLCWRLLVGFCTVLFDTAVRLVTSLGQGSMRSIVHLFSRTSHRVTQGVHREIKAMSMPAHTPKSAFFKVINFFLVLCLLVIPFLVFVGLRNIGELRTTVLSSTSKAVNNLFFGKSLIEQKDLAGAQLAFSSAADNFFKAQTDLNEINSLLLSVAGLVPDSNFRLASQSRHILKAGALSAKLGASLTTAATPSENADLTSFLSRFAALVGPAVEEAQLLERELSLIDISKLPEQYREQFTTLRDQSKYMAPSLKEAVVLSKQASEFLGQHMDKRYLLVFQNNAELRGSGGFMGSFALVDISRGGIKSITVPKGGTYDTEAGLLERIVAPKPLWLLNPLWHFWDANWWPDWPTTAKKLQWFYEKSDGPTVDGVISLTPTVIERLLHIHGPVDMTKEYGVVITAENFWSVTQTFSEQKPDITKEPKKIIGDLMTRLVEDLPKNMTPEKTFALITMLESSLDQKHILLFFNNKELEKTVSNFGWDGSIKNTDKDYLLVTSTNIGGQKTDRVISDTINLNTEILPDGRIIDTLILTRKHNGVKRELFTGVRNVNWLRVYVPENSRLISAEGFSQPDAHYFDSPDSSWKNDPDLQNENDAVTDPSSGTKIYGESGKTVFANWSMLDPGEEIQIRLQYELPFTVDTAKADSWQDSIFSYFKTEPSFRYSLLVQKQPGVVSQTFNSRLSVANGWKILWKHPQSLQVSSSDWQFTEHLETDKYITVLFHKM